MKTETVELNGMEMYYEIEGAGEPLLLLHGGGGCHSDWVFAGRDQLLRKYRLIAPDARGHGQSTNPQKTITHRQCALDALALLDHLGIDKSRAIGLSMGGNTLLHMATMQPDRIEAMVLVSATMYFPEQARTVMRQVPVDNQPPEEWEAMRKRHKLGDEQIVALWEWQRGMRDSYDEHEFHSAILEQNQGIHANRIWGSRLSVSGRDSGGDVSRYSSVCPVGGAKQGPRSRLS
ncbi:MAG: alpha/beta hydrolase [Candidatus Sulfotelmatobacter sp.]